MIYKKSGSRIVMVNLSPAGIFQYGYISWTADVPAGTSISVSVSIDGITYTNVTNGGTLPLTVDSPLSGVFLYIKEAFSSSNVSITPTLYDLTVGINSNRSPSAPAVIYPNGGEDIHNSVSISWSGSIDPDGDAVSYDVGYQRDVDTSPTVIATGVTSNSYVWNVTSVPTASDYRVCVRTQDSKGAYSAWDYSNVVFSINVDSPPTESSWISTIPQCVDYDADFVWEQSQDPESAPVSYIVEVSKDGVGWVNVFGGNTTNTQVHYDFSNLEEASNYIMRVRAYDGLNYSDWTYTPTFQVKHYFRKRIQGVNTPNKILGVKAWKVIGVNY